MQEVKRPKKPLIYFYVAMILAILVFNCLVVPYLAGKAIEDVDYGTFMTMTENGEIGKVQIQQNRGSRPGRAAPCIRSDLHK